MVFYKNNRCTLSTYSVLQLCLVIPLLMMPYTAHAQWSQTLGWGGAGYGKRSQAVLTSSSVPQIPNTCAPNPIILLTIRRLIEAELKRLQSCKYETKRPDTEAQTILDDFLSK